MKARFTQAKELGRYLENEYILSSHSPLPPLDRNDVLIASYPKCGTTLTQHLTYMLISQGDTSFHEIGRVSPYLDYVRRCRQPLHFYTPYTPHLLKTHLLPIDLPENQKAICCFRDPGDAAVSYYHFLTNWLLDPKYLTLDDFVQDFFCSPTQIQTSYWNHLLTWYKKCQEGKALALAYEKISKDKSSAIQKICAYLTLEHDESIINAAKIYTSFEWMKKNEHKFNESDLREHSEFISATEIPTLTTKVRKGKIGSSLEELSAASLNLLDTCWKTTVTPVTGWLCYQDVLNDLDTLSPDG